MTEEPRYTESQLREAFRRGAQASLDAILRNVAAMKVNGTFPNGEHKRFPEEMLKDWKLPLELKDVSIPATCDFVSHIIGIARNSL